MQKKKYGHRFTKEIYMRSRNLVCVHNVSTLICEMCSINIKGVVTVKEKDINISCKFCDKMFQSVHSSFI